VKVDVPKLLERLGITPTSTGVETWARCPFPDHEDKNPSFQIHDEEGDEKNGWFTCFSCGKTGGAVQLVSGLLGWTKVVDGEEVADVKRALAWIRKNDLVTHELQVFATKVRSTGSLYGAPFRIPRDVFFGPLEEWPGPPRTKLEARGVTAEQVRRWGIGYAVTGSLKHRWVIPKRDATGKAVGYTARTYLTREKKRYLEPSEREGADPAAVWGEEHWLSGERGTVVVVEGALDGLACERVVPPTWSLAALSGASRTSGRVLEKVGTFARVLVVTDGDQAGEIAALALREGCPGSEVVRVSLGDEDANEIERRDPGALRALLRG
jgi:DNA primase